MRVGIAKMRMPRVPRPQGRVFDLSRRASHCFQDPPLPQRRVHRQEAVQKRGETHERKIDIYTKSDTIWDWDKLRQRDSIRSS